MLPLGRKLLKKILNNTSLIQRPLILSRCPVVDYRSSWSGSWTLSFDANDDHSCKPASHCLLRESTPINTKDSNSLPKPHDFAWPQSEQSTATEHVTSPVTHWSRSKTTSLSPAIKKALSYHGATQQQKKQR